MNIKELQISNILSFKYYEDISNAPKIVFGADLNIFIGENGSGKSTALEVINFVFKRVLFTQFNFNQDNYWKREDLTGPQRKEIIAVPDNKNLNGFRLDPTWGYEDKAQKIRLVIQLDEIDRKNIELLTNHKSDFESIVSLYSNLGQPVIGDSTETFTIDLTLNKNNNSFSHTITPTTSSAAFSYLANYNYYKELIRIHNFENPNNLISPLYESFALIGSFRNYHSFNTTVSLKDKSGAQQIQAIYDKDFKTSLNSNENAEPAIFSLVRLRIADSHFDLFGSKMDSSQCEIEVNKAPFLLSINKRLKLVNLECKIRLTDQRTWQYSFEFTDIKRNQTLKDINSLSAGQKAIVHLVFEAYGRGDLKGGLVVIDEPEIHLHYQFQHEYLRVIKDLNHDQKSQYVLVTHSESLINSATIHNVKRFTLDQNRYTAIMSPSLTLEQRVLIKILDNTRATYAFFGKKVVLVEGDSDRYFFKAALDEINPSISQEISVIDVGGKGGFESWRDFFQSFGLQVYYIGDFDNVFSLLFDGSTLITQDKWAQAEATIKQQKLDTLTPQQQSDLKAKYDHLVQSPYFLTKPPRERWKPLLDMFINLSQAEKKLIVDEVKKSNANLDALVESKYSNNVFLLKSGDLEKYLGLTAKGLSGVVRFCNSELKAFMVSTTGEAKEIRSILEKVLA